MAVPLADLLLASVPVMNFAAILVRRLHVCVNGGSLFAFYIPKRFNECTSGCLQHGPGFCRRWENLYVES